MNFAPFDLPPIVCGIDHRYTRPLGTLMSSIAAAHPDCIQRLRMIVLHHDLGREHQAGIAELATKLNLRLDFHQADPHGFPVSGWASPANYLRLAIPDAVGDIDRALYLDCDTIVLKDLRPLLLASLDGAPIGAVRDARNPVVGHGLALPGHAALGIEAGRGYFNSGVMLLDLGQCSATGVFERAHRFLNDHPEQVRLWDQDALNVAADDRWHRLDVQWNVFATSPLLHLPDFWHVSPVTPTEQLIADEATAAVLHFAGPDKPWHDHYPPGPLRDLWRSFDQENR